MLCMSSAPHYSLCGNSAEETAINAAAVEGLRGSGRYSGAPQPQGLNGLLVACLRGSGATASPHPSKWQGVTSARGSGLRALLRRPLVEVQGAADGGGQAISGIRACAQARCASAWLTVGVSENGWRLTGRKRRYGRFDPLHCSPQLHTRRARRCAGRGGQSGGSVGGCSRLDEGAADGLDAGERAASECALFRALLCLAAVGVLGGHLLRLASQHEQADDLLAALQIIHVCFAERAEQVPHGGGAHESVALMPALAASIHLEDAGINEAVHGLFDLGAIAVSAPGKRLRRVKCLGVGLVEEGHIQADEVPGVFPYELLYAWVHIGSLPAAGKEHLARHGRLEYAPTIDMFAAGPQFSCIVARSYFCFWLYAGRVAGKDSCAPKANIRKACAPDVFARAERLLSTSDYHVSESSLESIMCARNRSGNMSYPRPDFHRGIIAGEDWIDLNGEWDFRFDPEDAGEEKGLHESAAEFDRTIRVPFPWESHAAWGTEAVAGCEDYFSKNVYISPADVGPERIGEDNYRKAPRHTIGWYRRAFRIPEQWANERVILNVGAADWEIKVWINGECVGESESGYLPVEFDVTDYLVAGENIATCRVHDPQDDEAKPLGKQTSNWYTPTSGIWQPVWLARRPEAYIAQVHLTPNAGEGSVAAEVVCRNAPTQAGIRLTVADEDGTPVAEEVLKGNGQGGFEGVVACGAEVRLWTPEEPHLYDVTVALRASDETIDTVHSYFGMRDVGVKPRYENGPNYVAINGQPRYLKGALDQSFNPWGVYSYPSEEAIREHLEQAQAAGFNFLRVHVKVEDPRYLYWADRLGLMLQCDLPNFGMGSYSEPACRRHEALLRGTVARDYNHPSIISWCLFNETWGLGGEEYKDKEAADQQAWVEEMYRLAKELDGTRLIEDNSPCLYDHVVTDLNSWHFYINDYERAKKHVSEVVERTCPGSDFNFVPGYTQEDQPLLNSEYGGISARMGDKDVSWCFKFLTDLLRREEKICGYLYTELHDIEWERNGVYNYDGSAKEFGYDIADLQADPYFAFEGPPGETFEPGSGPDLRAFIACTDSSAGAPAEVEIRVSGVDALGQELADLPAWRIEWDESGEGKPGPVLGATCVNEAALPERSCLLKLEAMVEGRFADFKYLEVCTGRLPAVEELADGSVVLRKLAGEQEHSSGWHEAEMERGLVGSQIHLLGGIEAGHFDYVFELPEGMELSEAGSIRLIAELSSKMQDARQTEQDAWPSYLEVHANGVHVHSQMIGDQYADSRGALSHIRGFWGRYGDLVCVEVEADGVREIARADGEGVRLRLSVPREATPGGLTVYSSRAGRYPVDVTLTIGFSR